MPSSTLNEISRQIEQEGTDHFTKFYMYAGLLKLATVRESNKTIFTVQPQTSSLFGKNKSLELGIFSGDFATRVNHFQNGFQPSLPNLISVAEKIVMAYARKGQLSDLVFIMDKMLEHVSTNPLQPVNPNNKGIYKDINFAQKRTAIVEFLNSFSKLNHQFLSLVDNVTNAGIASAVAVSGLIVMLATLFSLGGFLLGSAMIAGGLLASAHFGAPAFEHFEAIQHMGENVLAATKKLNETMSTYEELVNNDNHKNFVLSGIMKPVCYSAVTLFEQLAPDEETANQADENRAQLDRVLQIARL